MKSKKSFRWLLSITLVMLLTFGTSFTALGALVDPEPHNSQQDPTFEGYTAYKFDIPGGFSKEEFHTFFFKDLTITGEYNLSDTDWVKFQVYDTDDGEVVDWESNVFISKVLIKGGPSGNLYDYGDGVKMDSGLHAQVNPSNGKYYGVSHITVYVGDQVEILGSIAGIKYHDRNADGMFDPLNEEPLQGWIIEIYDDLAMENMVASVVTDIDGNFSFGDLPLGTYYIKEVQQDGWYQSTPMGPDYFVVDLTEDKPDYPFDENDLALRFGNYQKGSISGYKFNDENENGLWDESEFGLEGWTINLWIEVDDSLTIVATTLTNALGYYEFNDLMPNVEFFVSEVIPEGWIQSYPSNTMFIEGVGYLWGAILLTSGDISENNNFGNYLYVPPTSETAWAYGGNQMANPFTSYGFKNWGWTNGSLSEGQYEFDLYAGAGNNNLDAGTHVGTVTVLYQDGVILVNYTVFAGFTLDEVHLYIGSEPLPKAKNGKYTNAPGQFAYTAAFEDGMTSYGFGPYAASGNVYIAAHAVVTGYFD